MGIKACLLLCCCTVTAFASPLDKEKMRPSMIRFQNLQAAKGYTFYWRADHGSFTYIFTKDSSFSIPADEKHPDGGYFWGINSSTKKATNTIEFRNNFSPDRLIFLKAIINDSIVYDEQKIANANVLTKMGSTTSKPAVTAHITTPNTPVILFIIAGLVALATIALFLFRNKKRKAQGTGS